MTYSLSAAACWVILAAVLATIPSNDNHWRRAYALMIVGLPLLIWVYWENGVWIGLACTAAVASVFRWPVRYAFVWIMGKVSGRAE